MVTWLYYFSFQPDIKRKHIQQLEWRTICVYLSNHGCEEEEGERSSIHAGNYFLQRDGALLVLNRNCKKKFYWSKFRGVGGGAGVVRPLRTPLNSSLSCICFQVDTQCLIYNCNQIHAFLDIKCFYCVLIIRMLHYPYKWN